ncbi:MAG: PadR family transcriptional regulator [Candidatus Kariarchaeaceae archaeon]|jgi:DNA-binding PadR family transcriptional regulator
MWINAFAEGGKVLSPIELFVLATVPEKDMTPRAISESLTTSIQEWQPAPGTLYPILHRLQARGLLDKTKVKPIGFRRNERGTLFLSSILKPLKVQMRETNLYYLAIIEAVLKIQPTPIGIHQFMQDVEVSANDYLSSIQQLKKISAELKDDAFDVPISFE